MSLTPYSETVATGAQASAVTETYDRDTRGRSGLIVAYEVTSPASGFSLTVTISGLLPSGTAYTILASAATSVSGNVILEVRPGLVAVANRAISAQLPARIRISVTHTDATALQRTVEYELVG